MRFKCSHADHSVFVCTNNMGTIIVPVSTDNMMVTGSMQAAVNKFKMELCERYKIMDLRSATGLIRKGCILSCTGKGRTREREPRVRR